ncbi:21733_t:CDS:2 [Cetraspora pellucida]|uniref:21733_t:CDS:1 n=1 Tax=Cetraspora pellucida TaxID=1433469 RepID=A0A9N9DUF3_9GLOM|nr:21733_t:CDS:2 [Cetraspora pellucida]
MEPSSNNNTDAINVLQCVLLPNYKYIISSFKQDLHNKDLVNNNVKAETYTTAELDMLNTPLILLSTSTSIGGLSLAVILTLDEKIDTLKKALDIIKNKMSSATFGEHGSRLKLQIIMTNNCKTGRMALSHI